MDCNRPEEPGLSRRTTGEARNTSSSTYHSLTGGNQFERRAPRLLGKAGLLLAKHVSVDGVKLVVRSVARADHHGVVRGTLGIKADWIVSGAVNAGLGFRLGWVWPLDPEASDGG